MSSDISLAFPYLLRTSPHGLKIIFKRTKLPAASHSALMCRIYNGIMSVTVLSAYLADLRI